MIQRPNLNSVIPPELHKQVKEWVSGRHGRDCSGVPVSVIEQVTTASATVYRLEIDITLVNQAARRQTLYVEVIVAPGAPPRVDQDTVVFFD
jgi:hypothetical protein